MRPGGTALQALPLRGRLRRSLSRQGSLAALTAFGFRADRPGRLCPAHDHHPHNSPHHRRPAPDQPRAARRARPLHHRHRQPPPPDRSADRRDRPHLRRARHRRSEPSYLVEQGLTSNSELHALIDDYLAKADQARLPADARLVLTSPTRHGGSTTQPAPDSGAGSPRSATCTDAPAPPPSAARLTAARGGERPPPPSRD